MGYVSIYGLTNVIGYGMSLLGKFLPSRMRHGGLPKCTCGLAMTACILTYVSTAQALPTVGCSLTQFVTRFVTRSQTRFEGMGSTRSSSRLWRLFMLTATMSEE